MNNTAAGASPVDCRVRPLVEKLRERKQAVAWSRGQDADYPTKWEPDALCQQAADEIARLCARLNDALFVLVMVNKNNRIAAGEKGKAWDGRFVAEEVRRVLDDAARASGA